MRIEWSVDAFDLAEAAFRKEFVRIAQEFKMAWRLAWSGPRLRIAIFVSRYQHCLIDLLHRNQIGELAGDVAMVVSNHREAEQLASFYGIPFQHFPKTTEDRLDVEKREMELLESNQIDLIVPARSMQVLSPQFVAGFPERIVNVHHPFLPAFTGAKPYQAAFERGVKLIGATSHYVTEALDEGPIIAQDVARITHRDQVQDLVQKGRDLERMVRSRAVRWRLEHRILFYGNKTVIFD